MNLTNEEIANEILGWGSEKRLEFLELFLFEMTVANRVIWDNPNMNDTEKVECLKWSNELNHRIWNIVRELKRGKDDDSIVRFYNHLRFYREQSPELGGHMGAILKSSFNSIRNK